MAADQPPGAMAYADPRTALIGWRIIGEKGKLPSGSGYDGARIALGLADTDGDIGSGLLFPHEANFDQFGGGEF